MIGKSLLHAISTYHDSVLRETAEAAPSAVMIHTEISNPFLNDTAGLGRTTTLFGENGLRTLLLHLKTGEQVFQNIKLGVR